MPLPRPVLTAAAVMLALTGCVAAEDPPVTAPDTPAEQTTAAPDVESAFVPSLAPREGRPCGDIVGMSYSGAFSAGIVQLGGIRNLVRATPEMEACVQANGLEVEFTTPSF